MTLGLLVLAYARQLHDELVLFLHVHFEHLQLILQLWFD